MLWNGNVRGNNWSNKNLKETISSTDNNKSKTTGECRSFRLFGQHDNKWCKMYTENLNLRLQCQSSIQQEAEYFHQQIGFKFKEETNKFWTWSIALCGAETWTLRKADQKYSESFEMWCWSRMEKTSWTDRVRNEKVLDQHRAKEELNMLQAIRRMKVNLLRTKHNLLYIRNQSVPRCKPFPPRL